MLISIRNVLQDVEAHDDIELLPERQRRTISLNELHVGRRRRQSDLATNDGGAETAHVLAKVSVAATDLQHAAISQRDATDLQRMEVGVTIAEGTLCRHMGKPTISPRGRPSCWTSGWRTRWTTGRGHCGRHPALPLARGPRRPSGRGSRRCLVAVRRPRRNGVGPASLRRRRPGGGAEPHPAPAPRCRRAGRIRRADIGGGRDRLRRVDPDGPRSRRPGTAPAFTAALAEVPGTAELNSFPRYLSGSKR